jgi:hydrogenase expression/formation protein HypC
MKFCERFMCLAIPGKILDISNKDGLRAGRVEFGGMVNQVCLNFVPEANVGDYVVVHVGFALSRVDREEAERTYQLLEAMGLLEDELSPSAQGAPETAQ